MNAEILLSVNYRIIVTAIQLLLIAVLPLIFRKEISSGFKGLKRKELILLLILCIFGFYLRFESYYIGGIGDGTIYSDSAALLVEEQKIGICKAWSPDRCLFVYRNDHPWGFTMVIFYLFQFGVNYLTPVLLVAILSSASIALIFFLSYLLFKSTPAAFMAAFLYTINPIELLFGSSSFSEPFSAFFIILTLLALFLYLEQKSLGILMLLSLLASYSIKIRFENMMLIPVIFIAMLLFKPSKMKYILPLALFVFFSLDLFIYHIDFSRHIYHAGNFGFSNFIINLLSMFSFQYVAIIFIIPLSFPIALFYRNRFVRCLLLFLVSLAIPLLSFKHAYFGHARYFVIFDIFLVPLAAYILWNLLGRITLHAKIGLLVVAILLFAIYSPEFYWHPTDATASDKNLDFSALVDICPVNSSIIMDKPPEHSYFRLFHNNSYSVISILLPSYSAPLRNFTSNKSIVYIIHQEPFDNKNGENYIYLANYTRNSKVEHIAKKGDYELLKITKVDV